jgi:hypothetical protein
MHTHISQRAARPTQLQGSAPINTVKTPFHSIQRKAPYFPLKNVDTTFLSKKSVHWKKQCNIMHSLCLPIWPHNTNWLPYFNGGPMPRQVSQWQLRATHHQHGDKGHIPETEDFPFRRIFSEGVYFSTPFALFNFAMFFTVEANNSCIVNHAQIWVGMCIFWYVEKLHCATCFGLP